MHVWFGNIFDYHGDVIVPRADSLVVGCCDKTPVLVYERDGIDWPKMLVVFLDDFTSVNIVLYLGLALQVGTGDLTNALV